MCFELLLSLYKGKKHEEREMDRNAQAEKIKKMKEDLQGRSSALFRQMKSSERSAIQERQNRNKDGALFHLRAKKVYETAWKETQEMNLQLLSIELTADAVNSTVNIYQTLQGATKRINDADRELADYEKVMANLESKLALLAGKDFLIGPDAKSAMDTSALENELALLDDSGLEESRPSENEVETTASESQIQTLGLLKPSTSKTSASKPKEPAHTKTTKDYDTMDRVLSNFGFVSVEDDEETPLDSYVSTTRKKPISITSTVTTSVLVPPTQEKRYVERMPLLSETTTVSGDKKKPNVKGRTADPLLV